MEHFPSNFMDEDELIHTLAVDPEAVEVTNADIALAPPGTNIQAASRGITPVSTHSLERAIKEQSYRAFFAVLAEQKDTDPHAWAELMASILIELRDEVLSQIRPSLRDHDHMRRQLMERIDRELVQQMLRQDCFDGGAVMSTFSLLAQTIGTLERPDRRIQSHEWWAQLQAKVTEKPEMIPDLIPDMFRFIHDKVEQVKLDILTSQIELLRPIARQYGSEFERQRFQNIDPKITKAWIQQLILDEKASPIFGKPNPTLVPILESVGHHSTEAFPSLNLPDDAIRELIFSGGLRLISSPRAHPVLPETFRFDGSWIRQFQESLQLNTIVGIVISLAYNFDRNVVSSANGINISPRSVDSSGSEGGGISPSPPPSPGGTGRTTNRIDWLKNLVAAFTAALRDPSIRMSSLNMILASALSVRLGTGVITPANSSPRSSPIPMPDLHPAVKQMVDTFDAACVANHTLYRTVQKRILSFIWAVLTDNADEIAIVMGREAIPVSYLAEDGLLPLATKLKKILLFNCRTFSDVYRSILLQLVNSEMQSTSPVRPQSGDQLESQ